MQVADTYEDDESRKRIQTGLEVSNSNEKPSSGNFATIDFEQRNGILDEVCPLVSSPSSNTNNQIATGSKNKRTRKGKNITTNKRAKRNIHVDREPVNVAEKQVNDNDGSSLTVKRTRKQIKRAGLGSHVIKSGPENHVALHGNEKMSGEDGKNKSLKLSATSGERQGADGNSQNIRSQSEGRGLSSKRQKTCSLEVNMLKYMSIITNRTDECTMPKPSLLSLGVTGDKKTSDLEEPASNNAKEFKTAIENKRKSRCDKMIQFSSNSISNNGLADQNQRDQNYVSARENQSTEKVPGSANVRVQDPSTVKKLLQTDDVFLRKCAIPPEKVRCSFCHASEDSEVVLLPLFSHVEGTNILIHLPILIYATYFAVFRRDGPLL